MQKLGQGVGVPPIFELPKLRLHGMEGYVGPSCIAEASHG